MYGLKELTDEEFKTYFSDPIQKKYPYITLEPLVGVKGSLPEELITSGSFPDIILTSVARIPEFMKLQVLEDISPLIKKNSISLDRFEPSIIDSFRWYSDKGEVFGLPYSINFAALFYNKNIFDKFGIPYPKDGMTWDDALELSRKLTRNVDGVQYKGLDTGGVSLMGFGLSLPYVNKAANKAALQTDQWKMVLDKAKEFYEIPGMIEGDKLPGAGEFTSDQRMAMMAAWGNGLTGTFETLQAEGKPLHWDMVTIPNFKEAMGYSREADYQLLMVSKTSKYKEQAFQVISHITGDELQDLINRKGRLTSLKKNDQFKKSFAADLPSYKGKNMNAVFGVKPQKLHEPSDYDANLRTLVNNTLREVVVNKKDTNTALREANEKGDKYILDESNK
ncbi:ABC transporter substrate-binding protein [Paenibacillus solanacearum]|nr:extracellular solute-binding protein [Paenibacillus solanacearum]